MDDRYLDSPADQAKDVRYFCYGGGRQYLVDPNDVGRRPDFGDN